MVGRAEATAILEADATWWLYELARCHLSARGAPVGTPDGGGQARDAQTWLRSPVPHNGWAGRESPGHRAPSPLGTSCDRSLMK